MILISTPSGLPSIPCWVTLNFHLFHACALIQGVQHPWIPWNPGNVCELIISLKIQPMFVNFNKSLKKLWWASRVTQYTSITLLAFKSSGAIVIILLAAAFAKHVSAIDTQIECIKWQLHQASFVIVVSSAVVHVRQAVVPKSWLFSVGRCSVRVPRSWSISGAAQ